MAQPSYYAAAGNHTLLNSTEESWTTTILNAPKSLALGIGAGITELLNIPITVGSWFGSDTERIKYKEVLQSYDDDLSKYYQDHKLGIDVIGLITSSIVPGMAGVKVLNAGQTMLRAAGEGAVGNGIGTALGLLAPNRTKALAEATAAIRSSGSVFSLTEANTLRALGTGLWQNTLEAAAFETMVAATLYKSPILDQLSVSDLVWNIAIGTGIGGAAGGIFSGISTTWKIHGAGKAAQQELAPWTRTSEPRIDAPASEKFLFRMNQLAEIPEVPTTGDLASRIGRTATATKEKLWLDIRDDFGNMTSKDQSLAESLFQFSKLNSIEDNVQHYLDAAGASRLSGHSAIEKELATLTKDLRAGKLALDSPEMKRYSDLEVSYIKLHGEGAGSVTHEHPSVTSITDYMKDKDKIELLKNGRTIKFGNKKYDHDNNPHMPFDMFGADAFRVQSRYWWADKLPGWVDNMVDPYTVHATDIPLLTKVYRDNLERLNIIPEGGSLKDVVKLNSRQEIYDFIISQKQALGERLQKALPGKIGVQEFTDKMKGLFGINFNLTEELNPRNPYYGFFHRVAAKSGALDVKADVIALDKLQALTVPLSRMVRTLKHEEGHRTFQALLDAGGVTTANIAARWPLLYTEMRKIGDILRPQYYKHAWTNLPRETVIHEYFADTFYYLSRHPEKAHLFPATNQAIGHLVKPIPQEVLDATAKRAAKLTPEEAAMRIDVESQWLDGSARRQGGEFARDLAREEYKEKLLKANVRPSEIPADPLELPMYAKVYSEKKHIFVDGNEIHGIAKVMQQAKLYDEASARRAAHILGQIIPGEVLPRARDKDVLIATEAGPSFVGSANAPYGSIGSFFQYVGQRAHELKKVAKERTSEFFTPTLHKLGNNLDEAIEWSVLNEKLRNLPQKYYLDKNAETGEVSLVYKDTPVEVAKAALNNIPPRIKIKGEQVAKLVEDHISQNGMRVKNRGIIRAGEGLPDNLDPDAFYPIPRDAKDTPYFAFVIDDSVTSTGHSKMIYADSDVNLQKLINEIHTKMPEVKVLSKPESEAYFKVHGEFEFERTINSNWINDLMVRRGVSASYLPMTDPSRIVQSFLEWHLKRDTLMVQEAIAHQYSRQFEALRQASGESLNAALSTFRYTNALHAIETAVDNPATNMIKMALDVQKTTEYPRWTTMNRYLDQKFSQMWARTGAVLTDATTPEHLEAISSSLQKAGYNGISGISAELYNAMNAKVPRGTLTSFINKANGLLATFALRMDPLNAMNNALGQNVLLGTETVSVVRAIRAGNAEAVGELSKLMQIAIPGAGDLIDSPAKLIANSMSRYHSKVDRDFYKKHGFITSITDQYDQTLDVLAISAGDTVASLNKRIADAMTVARKVGDTGERLTANRFAEEFNRFVAADVMKQITDVAVRHGIFDEKTALTYINTFVNRTQGNFLASQRPLLFQGPIGQAIGLFQTYQFNLIQQLTRHIGEGQLKNAAVMMGLQSTIYGANGLPGFNAINTYIIGSAPGNTDHNDLYRAAYNFAGKDTGDWLMYGFGSNWMSIFSADLKNNLYSRGDINPRNITIVPTLPDKVPIVQATVKLLSNMKESFQKVSAGADVWSTVLRGIEQNGVSRPLAGMAQVLGGITSDSGQVTPVSAKGNILLAHDWMNFASLTRILGGKPLDEALVNDALYRFNSYRANDAAKKATLGEAIKISILGGSEPDKSQIEEFSSAYARAGGDQKDFVQFMMRQYKNASISQANQLREKLSLPYNQTMQEILGGYSLQDLSRQPSPEIR